MEVPVIGIASTIKYEEIYELRKKNEELESELKKVKDKLKEVLS